MPSPSHPTSSDRDKTSGFLRLLGTHERNLITFILALVPSWTDADDIAQEVRIRLWQQFDNYDPSKDFGTWARTIAYWEVRTWLSRRRRSPQWVNTELVDLIANTAAEQGGDSAERILAMQGCLQKLKPASRHVLELYYSGKKSARELAEDLNQSFDSVRHMIQRTRLALAKCIRQSMPEEEP